MANNGAKFETVGDLAQYLSTLDQTLPVFIWKEGVGRRLSAQTVRLRRVRTRNGAERVVLAQGQPQPEDIWGTMIFRD